MARVTVEDCATKIYNRFELVVLAAERVHNILSGDPIKVARDNDKNPVIALREIALGEITPEELKENLIKSHQKYIPMEDEEDILAALADEQKWVTEPESSEMKEELKADDLHVVDEDGEEVSDGHIQV